MQQYDSNTFYGHHNVLTRQITYTSATKYCRWHCCYIATEHLARNLKEVVFYFLPRNLKNEEREFHRKKVKDTPLLPGVQDKDELITSAQKHEPRRQLRSGTDPVWCGVVRCG